jgi:nucleoside-diphosphate-sugar epimerase
LVTGGSGFLGINLVRHLLAHGCEVSSIDLEKFTYRDCMDSIRWTVGDIRKKNDVDDVMRGIDCVVHCAAALPLYTEEEIYTTDVEGTRTVIQSAKEHGVKRFIFISSTAVYGVPDHHPLFETDKLIGVGPYGISKIQAEEICSGFRGDGMTVTIIRPKSFIGPERLGVFAMLYDWAYTGHNFPILGKGDNLYQFLDVEDLCSALWLCLTLPEAQVDDTFNIGAGEYRTLKEDFQSVLDEAGHGKKMKSIPIGPALFFLRLFEKLGASPLYQWIYDTVFRESFVSIEKARQQLGYAPKYSNKDALIRNYRWYVEHLEDFKNSSGVSHRVPWKQGILSLAKLFF